MNFYVINKKTKGIKFGPFDTELEAKAEMFAYDLSSDYEIVPKPTDEELNDERG